MTFHTDAATATTPSPSSSLQDLQKQPLWVWCGERVPKTQIVFFCQIFVVYCVIGAAITNLSLQHGDKQLWTILLSSCIGYLLPNPSLKFSSNGNNGNLVPGASASHPSNNHHNNPILGGDTPLTSSNPSDSHRTLEL
jgi:hypothetical protein